MFEKHNEKKLVKEYDEDLAKWQAERDGYAELLQLAETFNALPTDEIVLASGEAVFYKVAGAALLGSRSGLVSWELKRASSADCPFTRRPHHGRLWPWSVPSPYLSLSTKWPGSWRLPQTRTLSAQRLCPAAQDGRSTTC